MIYPTKTKKCKTCLFQNKINISHAMWASNIFSIQKIFNCYYHFTGEENSANLDENSSKPGCSQINAYAEMFRCDILAEFCFK